MDDLDRSLESADLSSGDTVFYLRAIRCVEKSSSCSLDHIRRYR